MLLTIYLYKCCFYCNLSREDRVHVCLKKILRVLNQNRLNETKTCEILTFKLEKEIILKYIFFNVDSIMFYSGTVARRCQWAD